MKLNNGVVRLSEVQTSPKHTEVLALGLISQLYLLENKFCDAEGKVSRLQLHIIIRLPALPLDFATWEQIPHKVDGSVPKFLHIQRIIGPWL